jgi:hypothetical protein
MTADVRLHPFESACELFGTEDIAELMQRLFWKALSRLVLREGVSRAGHGFENGQKFLHQFTALVDAYWRPGYPSIVSPSS